MAGVIGVCWFVEDAAVRSYDDGVCAYYGDGGVATRDGLGFLEGQVLGVGGGVGGRGVLEGRVGPRLRGGFGGGRGGTCFCVVGGRYGDWLRI